MSKQRKPISQIKKEVCKAPQVLEVEIEKTVYGLRLHFIMGYECDFLRFRWPLSEANKRPCMEASGSLLLYKDCDEFLSETSSLISLVNADKRFSSRLSLLTSCCC